MRNMKFYKFAKGKIVTEVVKLFDGGNMALRNGALTSTQAIERMALRGYLRRAEFERRHPGQKQARQEQRYLKSTGAA